MVFVQEDTDSESDQALCTVMCQQGTDKLVWYLHDRSQWSAPSWPRFVPVAEYSVVPWSVPPAAHAQCDKVAGAPPSFTVGMLARGSSEVESLLNSLKSYEDQGFLQVGLVAPCTRPQEPRGKLWHYLFGFSPVHLSPPPPHGAQRVPEFLLYLNERDDVLEAAVEKYTYPPFNVKVTCGLPSLSVPLAFREVV
jgi:hypothetical protein